MCIAGSGAKRFGKRGGTGTTDEDEARVAGKDRDASSGSKTWWWVCKWVAEECNAWRWPRTGAEALRCRVGIWAGGGVLTEGEGPQKGAEGSGRWVTSESGEG